MATKPHYDADTSDITCPKDGNGEHVLGPRAFNIVWGNDPHYWKIPERGSNAPTELLQVSWLEVTGSVSVEKGKAYKISFRLSMKGDASGWTGSPVFLMGKVGKRGKYTWKKLKQLEQCPKDPIDVPDNTDSFEIGVPNDAIDPRLYFGLYEVWSGKWKAGLRIHSATVKEIRKI